MTQKELDKLRKRAEAEMPFEKHCLAEMSKEDICKTLHELHTHQIELEIQNEELRLAQIALEESRSSFIDLYDFAPTGYLTISPNGLISKANLTASSLFGVERQLLLNQPLTAFIFNEDQELLYKCRKILLETKVKQSCELRMPKEDGHLFHAQLECVVFSHLDGDAGQFRITITDITERIETQQKLVKALTEKEVLIKEIHHRVKNNMQIISSLLYLQSQKAMDPETVETLKDIRERVRSMALIHEKFYSTADNFASINFGDYIRTLTQEITKSYATPQCPVQFNIEADALFLTLDIAIPCGLILNELITNRPKHPHTQRTRGEIQISLRRVADQKALLTVHDDGRGLPENFNFDSSPSLGMILVKNLTNQLDGTLEVRNDNGLLWSIAIPIDT